MSSLTPEPSATSSRPIPRARTCQWPLWGNTWSPPKPPRFCEAAIELGYPYCHEHCKLAYGANWQPRPQRQIGSAQLLKRALAGD